MNKSRFSAVNCIRKSWPQSFKNKIINNRVGFKSICAVVSRQYTELFYKFFYQSNWIWKVNGRLQIQKYPTHQSTKMLLRENICFFDKKPWKSSEFYYQEPSLYSFITATVEAMNTLIQERHNQKDNFVSSITVNVSRRTQEVETYIANERSGLAFISTDLGHIFESRVRNEFGVMLKGKGPQNQNLLTTWSAYTLSWYTRTRLNTLSLAKPRLHCCVAFLFFDAQGWRHCNYWTVHELSDI